MFNNFFSSYSVQTKAYKRSMHFLQYDFVLLCISISNLKTHTKQKQLISKCKGKTKLMFYCRLICFVLHTQFFFFFSSSLLFLFDLFKYIHWFQLRVILQCFFFVNRLMLWMDFWYEEVLCTLKNECEYNFCVKFLFEREVQPAAFKISLTWHYFV